MSCKINKIIMSNMDQELSFKGNNPGAVRYGNYINYYQFHPPETRIESLSTVPTHVWKLHDDNECCIVLDIGCNAGDLTVNFHTFFMKNIISKNIVILGVDIDPKLIERANKKYTNNNVSFQCLNIMDLSTKSALLNFLKQYEKVKFDIITCFSTTMWIHLNNGDDGLMKFLKLICELGLILIIEPQPWSRYREAVRRLKKESETFPMYEQLKLRSNVENEIESIVNKENFNKLYETTSLGWTRKVLFFSNKR